MKGSQPGAPRIKEMKGSWEPFRRLMRASVVGLRAARDPWDQVPRTKEGRGVGKAKDRGRVPWSGQKNPGSPPGSETGFRKTWCACLPNVIRRMPAKAQCPKTVYFSELETSEENDGGGDGDFIRFPFCWSSRGVGEGGKGRGREGKSLFYSPQSQPS